MAGAAHNRGNSRQDYQTPMALIRAIEARFGKLSIDLAASAENAKAEKFITAEQDSFKTDWPTDGLCWLNPPFANIRPWAKKCRETADRGGAHRVSRTRFSRSELVWRFHSQERSGAVSEWARGLYSGRGISKGLHDRDVWLSARFRFLDVAKSVVPPQVEHFEQAELFKTVTGE